MTKKLALSTQLTFRNFFKTPQSDITPKKVVIVILNFLKITLNWDSGQQ